MPRSPGVGQRKIDAVTIRDGERRIASPKESVSLDERNIIIVQTKAYRLGMYLMRQALFSRVLIEDRCAPRSVRTPSPDRRALWYRGCWIVSPDVV